jgi:hypothetical protein
MSGGAANSDPNACLGGTMSSTTISDNTLNNLWDDVSAVEASAGDVEYRAMFIYLATTSATLSNARLWISATTSAAGDEWAITTDTAGLNSSVTMSSISAEGTAPTNTGTWVVYGTTISVGNVTAGQGIGVWIRRSVSVGASSYASNSASITWDGETA